MIDQRARWRDRTRSEVGPARPLQSGQMPVLRDVFTARPETGCGLDSSGEIYGRRAGAAGAVGDPAGHVPLTVLTGEGGCGKSYLAAARMAASLRSGAVDLAAWIHVSSRSALLAGYAIAAADAGLVGRDAPAEEAAGHLLEWLTRTSRRWLIVLDHVADLTQLSGLWPGGQAGQVIVTCREPADLSGLAGDAMLPSPVVCRIGVFSPREALGFLTARLHDDTDQRVEAVDLADDLGYVPLALALASATMAGSTLSCRDYRHRLASRSQELAGRTSGAISPTEAAWSLALDRADQRAPAGLARPVLALTSLLDPGGMPAQLPATRSATAFLAVRGGGEFDPDHIPAVLGGLAGSGLLAVDESVTPPLLTVHPVVQAATRRLVPAAVLEEAARAVADGLNELWPALERDPVQARALRECAARLDETADYLLWSPEPHPVLVRAGTSLTDVGLAGPAVGYWQALLDRCGQAIGPGHPQTLTVRERLAEAYEAVGLVSEAIELTKVTVSDRERSQGADHPDTLAARASLARAYRTAGMTQAAIEMYEQVLAGRQWALGADHPESLGCRSQLASAYLAVGGVDRAIVLFERNLAEWQRIYGADDPQAIAEAMNLGSAYQAAGKHREAVAVFQRVVAIREQSLGRDHPDTLTACGQLAYAYRSAGRLKEAIPCYRQTLAGRERTLGADHPDTMKAMANLASCYQSARQMREAIALYERVLAARERVQGPDHPDTLTARGILAGAYHSAGRLANALPLYERAVADFERVLGPDHVDTLTSRGNLAHAYHMARRHSDAIAVFERTLADCERVLGHDHQLTRTIKENLDIAAQ
jgi:tetratricopeptide (TPR) repeat protein